jgi:hypothetical protein
MRSRRCKSAVHPAEAVAQLRELGARKWPTASAADQFERALAVEPDVLDDDLTPDDLAFMLEHLRLNR